MCTEFTQRLVFRWWNINTCFIITLYVNGSGKTGFIHTSTEIQFLSISERYTHALPRNTKYLAIDGQVCFYRRIFADAVKPQRCMSWSWGALIGLYEIVNCSSRQSGSPLWIVPVHVTYCTALLFESKWVLYSAFGSPPTPTIHPTPLPPAHPL